MKKPTYTLFKSVCESKGGNLTEIAKSLKVDRRSVYKWIGTSPDFKNALEEVRESVLDLTESQLLNLIKGVPRFKKDESGKFVYDAQGSKVFEGWEQRPSEAAIFFKLKTLGKSRGYVERVETETVNDPFAQLMSRVAKLKDEEKPGRD